MKIMLDKALDQPLRMAAAGAGHDSVKAFVEDVLRRALREAGIPTSRRATVGIAGGVPVKAVR